MLAALSALFHAGKIRKVLVIAPLRVAVSVWPREVAKWQQFKNLRIVVLHGRMRDRLLASDADIYVVNPEGLPWLVKTDDHGFRHTVDVARFQRLGFDTLVVDELTKFKHPNTARFKLLKPVLPTFKRRYGLTGSPAANGLMGLFGQMYVLDLGAALGRYITWFRRAYFTPGYSGFGWDLQPGADARIFEKIAPITMRLSGGDYVSVPTLIDDVRKIDLPARARAVYTRLERDLFALLENGVAVAAANAGVALGKCRQVANGAIYVDHQSWTAVHDAKLDALEELIEELQGEPILVAYEFRHDLERIRKRLGDVPYIGAGISPRRGTELEDQWNCGQLPVLLAHPQSVAHGLNLQAGGGHLCWFSLTWDYELYSQFIDRLRRQGAKHARIINHLLLADNTVEDKAVWRAIQAKAKGQDRLFDALRQLQQERASK